MQNERDVAKRSELLARIHAQKKFYPVGGYGGPKLSHDDVERKRKNATALLNMMDTCEIPAQLRFAQHEVTFPLPLMSYASNGYGTANTTLAPAAVFQGGGRQLGRAHDNEMKKAIKAPSVLWPRSEQQEGRSLTTAADLL